MRAHSSTVLRAARTLFASVSLASAFAYPRASAQPVVRRIEMVGFEFESDALGSKILHDVVHHQTCVPLAIFNSLAISSPRTRALLNELVPRAPGAASQAREFVRLVERAFPVMRADGMDLARLPETWPERSYAREAMRSLYQPVSFAREPGEAPVAHLMRVHRLILGSVKAGVAPVVAVVGNYAAPIVEGGEPVWSDRPIWHAVSVVSVETEVGEDRAFLMEAIDPDEGAVVRILSRSPEFETPFNAEFVVEFQDGRARTELSSRVGLLNPLLTVEMGRLGLHSADRLWHQRLVKTLVYGVGAFSRP